MIRGALEAELRREIEALRSEIRELRQLLRELRRARGGGEATEAAPRRARRRE